VEIYNEQIIDLLGSKKSSIRIRQNSNGGVHLQGATETLISDEGEALRLINIAIHNRSVASTHFNEKSSRSHLVIIMSLFISLTNGQEVHPSYEDKRLEALSGRPRWIREISESCKQLF
jgi:hypothetical protein